jgi:hypothetical protein
MTKGIAFKDLNQGTAVVTETLPLTPLVLEGLEDFKGSFDRLCLRAGTAAIEAMLAGDVAQLCGQRYERHGGRTAHRWGTTMSEVDYHGGKAAVRRPRVLRTRPPLLRIRRTGEPCEQTLVEQLYDTNKHLVGYEGRLMRLAESHHVAREDFLKNYQGSELDPRWLNRVSKLSARGWKSFVESDRDRIKQLRSEIHALATETGLEIDEVRRIVHMVQKGEREARQAKREMVEANSSSRSPRNTPIAACSSST